MKFSSLPVVEIAFRLRLHLRQHSLSPNPSFERTRNGMAPWPRSAGAYHALRGQGTMPLRSAQLQR
jgi:hypothetical protein